MPERFVNFYAGSPLNRLSWLRPSHYFLNAVAASPATRWMVFNSGDPLGVKGSEESKIVYLTTQDLEPILGSEPYFGQGQAEGELCQPADSDAPVDRVLQSARHRGSPAVFLGVHEDKSHGEPPALPTSEFSAANAKTAVEKLSGTPIFAIEVSNEETSILEKLLRDSSPAQQGQTLSWIESRSLMFSMDMFTSSVMAEGRSMVDWNHRNKFCAGCGSPVYSMWGGWKLSCTSLLPWADNAGRKPCISAKGLHNFTHPRTDAVVIMLAIDETGDRALLGRGRKYPGKFYSAMAGFIEPAESFEDAVKREMREEAGIEVLDVQYHSGQPWPYPANLMVGFYCRASSSQTIRVDLDNELEDARWFTRQEILDVVGHKEGTFLTTGKQPKIAAAWTEEEATLQKETADKAKPAPEFKLPPATAIAGVLLRDWVYGS